jgi:FMN phosphatase YigB (HAD superfamily)
MDEYEGTGVGLAIVQRTIAQRRMIVADTVRAILFDLDDTLLGNDMDRFLKAYFGLLAPHIAAYVPPEKFIPALLAATRTMVENTDPGVTNQQAFMADFFPRVGRTMDELMPVFDDFYATQFGKLRSHTRCLPEARAVVRAAFGVGYDVVIATNPLFPDTAIRQRLEWADVADFPFKLVTSYETQPTNYSPDESLLFPPHAPPAAGGSPSGGPGRPPTRLSVRPVAE